MAAAALVLVPEINLTPQLEARVRGRFPGAEVVPAQRSGRGRPRAQTGGPPRRARPSFSAPVWRFRPMPRLGLIVVDEGTRFLLQAAGRDTLFGPRRGRLPGQPAGHSRRPRVGDAGAGVWANRLSRSLSPACLTLTPRRFPKPACHAIGVDSRQACRKVSEGLAGGRTPGAGRAEPHLPQPPRLRAGPGLRRLRLGVALPALRRQPRRASGRPAPALPPLRLRDAGAEILPDLRQSGHPSLRPRHPAPGSLARRAVSRRPHPAGDRDAVKSRSQWEAVLARIHGGDADILVGTQMLARATIFPVLPWSASSGPTPPSSPPTGAPRAPLRQLMQVAGRAGRADLPGEVLIQTQYPDHPLYGALVRHDYPGYAKPCSPNAGRPVSRPMPIRPCCGPRPARWCRPSISSPPPGLCRWRWRRRGDAVRSRSHAAFPPRQPGTGATSGRSGVAAGLQAFLPRWRRGHPEDPRPGRAALAPRVDPGILGRRLLPGGRLSGFPAATSQTRSAHLAGEEGEGGAIGFGGRQPAAWRASTTMPMPHWSRKAPANEVRLKAVLAPRPGQREGPGRPGNRRWSTGKSRSPAGPEESPRRLPRQRRRGRRRPGPWRRCRACSG